MNIYNVYIASIYVLKDKEYKNIDNVEYIGAFIRKTLVLKKHDVYIDLFTKEKYKKSIEACEYGDAYINFKETFEPVSNYLDTSSPNISKKHVMKLIKAFGHLDNN